MPGLRASSSCDGPHRSRRDSSCSGVESLVEPRTQRARIADVAREAGASKTAVSFAFNAPDRLAPETATRIREVAEQLGYTPHPVARMLTQRQTMTIGVLTLPEHGSVEIDEVGGAQAAAAYIASLGHRDILVLGVEPPAPGGPDPDGVTSRRLRGYREAFAAVGVELTDERVVVGPASIDGGITATTGAFEGGLRPTAILAMSDAMAIGAMRALRDLRLSVPGDVSVVGFDDIDLAPHVDPPLTTVHQPIRRKGEEAVRALLTVVERRGPAQPEHRRLETRLIIRGSTGPVPSHRREVAGSRH